MSNLDLSPLIDLITRAWLAYGVVFLRVGGAILVLPGLGEATLPMRLRLAAAMVLTLVVTPALAPHLPAAPEDLGWRLGLEPMAGLAIGLVLRLLVMALNMAGTMIAQASSLAQMFGGGTGQAQPAVGHLLTMAGLALAFASGLHLRLALYLIQSYDLIPLAGPFPVADLRLWAVAELSESFALAFRLAAPFVLAALIYNATLGAINKAMPQLMVALVGAPALTLGALALMTLALPAALALWQGALDGFFSNPLELAP